MTEIPLDRLRSEGTNEFGRRIDLAHTPAFLLGSIEIRPSTREIIRDGNIDVVEPRVMQVLVALARTGGAIVSRDDLIHACWGGRIVGEDAINRVISRLRRIAQASDGGFRVDTVTKVGYRLVQGNDTNGALPAAPLPAIRQSMTRRAALAGGGLAAAAAVVAGGWLIAQRRVVASPAPATTASALPDVAALIHQASLAIRQCDPQGTAQAIGLYRQVVQSQPAYADGWGMLSVAYAMSAQVHASADSAIPMQRARAAADRATELDPDNPIARVGLVLLLPRLGHWRDYERVLGAALKRYPGYPLFNWLLGWILMLTGRNAEAASILGKGAQIGEPAPALLYKLIVTLWSANRLEEADRMCDWAYGLYPLHFAIWFTRFYLLQYTGRADQAIAMGEDRNGRPPGIPDEEFSRILVAARASLTGAATDIDVAMRQEMAAARRGGGYAENAMQFASSVGRLDEAFVIADAYFFGRGFTISEVRFTRQQGSYTQQRDRLTAFLFLPNMAPMRADPRFASLVRDIGLEDYWRKSKALPDYRRSTGSSAI